ncbi:uncharacterized protein V6R79_017257 [Siganus canaliculatus]
MIADEKKNVRWNAPGGGGRHGFLLRTTRKTLPESPVVKPGNHVWQPCLATESGNHVWQPWDGENPNPMNEVQQDKGG